MDSNAWGDMNLPKLWAFLREPEFDKVIVYKPFYNHLLRGNGSFVIGSVAYQADKLREIRKAD